LYASLDRRVRPEDLIGPIQRLLAEHLMGEDLKLLFELQAIVRQPKTAGSSWSSMADEFRRPVGMDRQLGVAAVLFAAAPVTATQDPEHITSYLIEAEEEIGKVTGRSDFMADRLNRAARVEIGLTLNHRQYNKRFRLAQRLERKRLTLMRELEKRALTMISKSRLASELVRAEFMADVPSACFIAYYTARCHLRSEFTAQAQQRPYDVVSEFLFARCRASDTTDWWAIAHVYPSPEVLSHLSAEQCGVLLGRLYGVLERAAQLMSEVWAASNIDRDTMVVRRGNDSSTWNVLAGAWNQARDGWINALYALEADELLDVVCPGKVMRLMAADVAYWHRAVGGGLAPDTRVWAELPLPWDVLTGEAVCTRDTVVQACQVAKIDPYTSGWIAPRTQARVAPFSLTPELVHGVRVGSPGLALLLRRTGVFSGKPRHEPDR